MPKIHPLALRERVVAHVHEGHTHRATAKHFKVSIKFVNDMIKLMRETGSLVHKPIPGPKGQGKLAPYHDWLGKRIAQQPDITLAQLALELQEQFDVDVRAWSICRVLHKLGLSHKKRQYLPKNSIATTS